MCIRDRVYAALSDFGLSVTAYHAGMTDEQREEAQNAFMNQMCIRDSLRGYLQNSYYPERPILKIVQRQ